MVVLIVASLVAIVYLGGIFPKKAALSVNSDPEGQQVLLDGQEVGETPFFSDQLDQGEAVLRFGDFNQKIHLSPGALTVVDWVLGPSETFSAGEVVWFSSSSTGTELLVITKPAGEVWLDGQLLGETPLSRALEQGEYDLEIKKEGYFSRQFKISVREGFRLNISANLALNPFPAQTKNLSSPHKDLTVLNLSSSQPLLSADPKLWVEGVIFWAQREESRSVPEFFLTADGTLYDSEGSEVSLSSLSKTGEKHTLGYLGTDDAASLAAAARRTLNSMIAKLYPTLPKVQILETGVGFLRVRSGPGKSYAEIGRATPGEKYTHLGEQSGWFKIDFHGRDGWVSGDYARKL